jgi:hypothetical protein
MAIEQNEEGFSRRDFLSYTELWNFSWRRVCVEESDMVLHLVVCELGGLCQLMDVKSVYVGNLQELKLESCGCLGICIL